MFDIIELHWFKSKSNILSFIFIFLWTSILLQLHKKSQNQGIKGLINNNKKTKTYQSFYWEIPVDSYSKITALLLTTQNLQHGLITVLNCQFKVHKGI
jgi:hypothetical protein